MLPSVLLMITASNAQADNFTVINTNDTGPGH